MYIVLSNMVYDIDHSSGHEEIGTGTTRRNRSVGIDDRSGDPLNYNGPIYRVYGDKIRKDGIDLKEYSRPGSGATEGESPQNCYAGSVDRPCLRGEQSTP